MDMTVKEVIKFICELDDEDIIAMYKDYSEKSKKNTIDIVSGKNIEEDRKTSDESVNKSKLLLKFVNKILKNIGKSSIESLDEFKNIDRNDIIKDENKKALDDMEKELFAHFNKQRCGYYRKTDGIVINCLRGMCKETGFTCTIKKKSICKNTILKTHSFYSIEKCK